MSEKTEWEIIDAEASSDASGRTQDERTAYARQEYDAFGAGASRGSTGYAAGLNGQAGLREALRTALGRWWRWKLAGGALVLITIVALLATVAGAFLLITAAVALMSLAVAKLRQWLGRSGSV